MTNLRTCLALLFMAATVPCVAQQQSSPGQTSTDQQKRDVPEQGPGTNNPDVSKEHNAPPSGNSSSGSTVKHRKKHHPKSAGTTDTSTSGS